jgi:hypothetical protein
LETSKVIRQTGGYKMRKESIADELWEMSMKLATDSTRLAFLQRHGNFTCYLTLDEVHDLERISKRVAELASCAT